MSFSLPHRKLPVASLADEQIAYVTDNDRDAEALSGHTECRVVVERRALPRSASRQTPADSQTFQTLKRFRHQNVPDVSLSANVSGVSNVSESETFPSISNVSDAPDISDVSDVSTPDL